MSIYIPCFSPESYENSVIGRSSGLLCLLPPSHLLQIVARCVKDCNELTAAGTAPEFLPPKVFGGQVTGFPIIPKRGNQQRCKGMSKMFKVGSISLKLTTEGHGEVLGDFPIAKLCVIKNYRAEPRNEPREIRDDLKVSETRNTRSKETRRFFPRQSSA